MSKKTYEDRMKTFDDVALPDPNTAVGREAREFFKQKVAANPKLRKQVKQAMKKAEAIYHAVMRSGAGFVADRTLREFYHEFVTRNWAYGLRSMPSSFNVLEAFISYRADRNMFQLLPEKDHLFDFEDFLDFVTGPDAPKDDVTAAYNLPNKTIHHYSCLGDARKFILAAQDGCEFGFGSVSMIRRDDEAMLMLVAGERVLDMDALNASLQEDLEEAKLQSSKIEPDPSLAQRAVELANGPGLWKHIGMTRLNLAERSMDVRYLYSDCGNCYTAMTDDLAALQPMMVEHGTEYVESFLNEQYEKLQQKAMVFEIAKLSIHLPAYFKFKYRLQRDAEYKTQITDYRPKTSAEKRSFELLDTALKPRLRTVSAIEVLPRKRSSSPAGRRFTAPRFQVHVRGFWRNYSNPEWEGHDEEGNPVKGKTWVHPHPRWRDRPARGESDVMKIIYVKSSLTQARKRIEAEEGKPEATPVLEALELTPVVSSRAKEEYLYTMINPALMADLYKVGFTNKTPEERAAELSQASGIPTKFIVIESWMVSDGRQAERQAHDALQSYRLTSNREFFQLKYEILRRVITESISDLLLTRN